jgi:hypothetical protein
MNLIAALFKGDEVAKNDTAMTEHAVIAVLKTFTELFEALTPHCAP